MKRIIYIFIIILSFFIAVIVPINFDENQKIKVIKFIGEQGAKLFFITITAWINYKFGIINYLLQGCGAYLEIGIEDGDTFCQVHAETKIGVDPVPVNTQIQEHLIGNSRCEYFQHTSDEFFKTFTGDIDVAFIDGLHTYEQSLADVENCLKFLNPGGFIVMHDCNPPNKAAARTWKILGSPNTYKMKIPWCGDVWKTIVVLRCREDLNVIVLDCDCGVGVITKGRPEDRLSFQPAAIGQMNYDVLHNNREFLLNLKPPQYLKELQLC